MRWFYFIVFINYMGNIQAFDALHKMQTAYARLHEKIESFVNKRRVNINNNDKSQSCYDEVLYKACLAKDSSTFFLALQCYSRLFDSFENVVTYKVLEAAYSDSRHKIFKKLLVCYGIDIRILLTNDFFKKYYTGYRSRTDIKTLVLVYPGILKTVQFFCFIKNILQSEDILIKDDIYVYFQSGFNPFVLLCESASCVVKDVTYFFHEYNSQQCALFLVSSYKKNKQICCYMHEKKLFIKTDDECLSLSPLVLTRELVCCLMSWVCYSPLHIQEILNFLVAGMWHEKSLDDYNRNALQRAVLTGAVTVVKAFLPYSDVTWTDNLKKTALLYAIYAGDLSCFDILVDNPFVVHKMLPFFISEDRECAESYAKCHTVQEKSIFRYMIDMLALNRFVQSCAKKRSFFDCMIITTV